jgi:iron-sulfur cluster assembly protein
MRTMATIEQEALVTLTDGAATKIKELMAEEPEGEAGVLRIAVQGGGCSGFEYALGFDTGAQEGDHQVDAYGIQVVVDPLSAPYLQGTEVDFVDGLQGGFAINNPNVVSACGCGHSFQVAEGEAPEDSTAAGCGSGCSA